MGSGTSFLHNALGVIASPFRAAGSAVVNWVDGISDHFASVEELQAENEALRQENAQLRQELQSAQPAAQENQRLRKLLDLREQRSDLKFEAARVTQRDVSNWASTLVLNRGSQHGVAENDCAVDCYGNLVGVVTEVGLNWCRLTTILDTGSQLGAMVFRTEGDGHRRRRSGADEPGQAEAHLSAGLLHPYHGGSHRHLRSGRVLSLRADHWLRGGCAHQTTAGWPATRCWSPAATRRG